MKDNSVLLSKLNFKKDMKYISWDNKKNKYFFELVIEMEVEQILFDKVRNDPGFLFITGSRLYGTSTEESDLDLRGYLIPPFEYLLNIKKFECQESRQEDYKVYSLKYYLQLILAGDPLLSESLFIPEAFIIKKLPVHKIILSLKNDLISNKIYNRIIGYSKSEWRKAMGLKYIIDKRTKTEDNIINDIRNLFKPEKEDIDLIIKILLKNKERKLISSIPSVGSKRKQEYEKYGYCVKSASHSIRLVSQLYELITVGNITFPRPEAEMLKDIRIGRYKKEEADIIYRDLVKKVEKVKDNSVLSDKPNFKKVWDTYLEIIVDFLRSDNRFLNFRRVK